MKQKHIIKNEIEATAVLVNLVDRLSTKEQLLVTIEPLAGERSLAINRLYWLWIGKIRDHILEVKGEVYDIDAIHEKMKQTFLEPKVYKFKDGTILKYSSKNLTNKDFCLYLEKLDFYCNDRLNLNLPHPIDQYDLAMGRK